jgi:2-iminobutanoate/2-iminopropanoate deaminase
MINVKEDAVRMRREPGYSRAAALLAVALLTTACATAPAAGPAPAARTATAAQREVINTPGVTRIGPYSPAIRAGDMVFFSGQIGRGEGENAIQTATRQALQGVRSVMDLAGVRTEELVKCSVFLIDIAEFSAMNAVYVEFFGDVPTPARTTLQVAALPGGARVEIECIAYAPRD